MSIVQAVGVKIRNYRQKLGLTQEELAEKADLHHTYVGQVERGEKNLTIQSLEKLLDAMDVSFAEFFSNFEILAKDSTIPAQCYTLVGSLDDDKQEKLLKLLTDIVEMMK